MRRETFIALVLVLLFVQTGCSLVRELKEDPAIVGATGVNLIIGFDVTPSSAVPVPKVHFNWGTSFRVGAHECVYISTAGGANAYLHTTPKTDSASDKTGNDKSKTEAESKPKGTADLSNKREYALQTIADTSQPGSDKPKTKDDGTPPLTQGSNSASCVPVVTQAPSQNKDDGSGGAGQAYLTISANGLEALKARWQQNARLDLLIGALKDIGGEKLTPEQETSILTTLATYATAGHPELDQLIGVIGALKSIDKLTPDQVASILTQITAYITTGQKVTSPPPASTK